MRVDRFVLTTLAVLLILPAAASALPGVFYDAQGTTTLTQDGWTLTRNWGGGTPDPVEKSKDYSTGMIDNGVGVWNINDNNSPVNAYMKMYKDPGPDNPGTGDGIHGLGGIDQSQGIILARVKAISGTTNGTFGYSSAAGNHSVAIAVRPGALAFKTADGNNTSASNVTLDTTSDYRVYAIQYVTGGTFNAWYTTTNDWSSNSVDWVQAVTNATASGALIDHTGTAVNALVMGAIGTSSNLWQGNVDWIAWSKYSDYQLPWNFPVPEPATLTLLGLGIVPLLRRRR